MGWDGVGWGEHGMAWGGVGWGEHGMAWGEHGVASCMILIHCNAWFANGCCRRGLHLLKMCSHCLDLSTWSLRGTIAV